MESHPASRAASRAAALLLVACWAPAAWAQNADIVSGSIATCNVKGNVAVTLPLLGTFDYPLPCVNRTERTAAGIDDRSVTGDVDLSVTPMLDVAHLKAPHGRAGYTQAPRSSSREGLTEVEEFDAVQGLLAANGVRGALRCSCSSETRRVECRASTRIAALLINGQPVSLPENVPLNHTLPIVGGSVRVKLPLLGHVVDVPVQGSAVLNEVVVTGSGTTQGTVEHNPVRLTLAGGVNVAGVGLVGVKIDVIDHSTWETTYSAAYPVAVEPSAPEDWL